MSQSSDTVWPLVARLKHVFAGVAVQLLTHSVWMSPTRTRTSQGHVETGRGPSSCFRKWPVSRDPWYDAMHQPRPAASSIGVMLVVPLPGDQRCSRPLCSMSVTQGGKGWKRAHRHPYLPSGTAIWGCWFNRMEPHTFHSASHSTPWLLRPTCVNSESLKTPKTIQRV